MSETERAREAGELAQAIEACDWPGMSIGHKAILRQAVHFLRALANRQQAPADATGGGAVREALEEAIEFAEQDIHALTPAGEAMVERWRAALASPPAAPAQAGSREEAVARAIRALVLATEDRSSGDTVEMNVGALTEIIGILATPPATRSEEEIRRVALEEAAQAAEEAHERWRGQDPCPVTCDITACEEIAAAIRARAGKPATAGEVR